MIINFYIIIILCWKDCKTIIMIEIGIIMKRICKQRKTLRQYNFFFYHENYKINTLYAEYTRRKK